MKREGVHIVLLNSPNRAKYDISSLKLIISGGSKLAPEVKRRIEPELGCKYKEVLGMTEGLNCWTLIDDPEEVRLYTQGAHHLLPIDLAAARMESMIC